MNNSTEVEASRGDGMIVDGYEFTPGSNFLGSVAKDYKGSWMSDTIADKQHEIHSILFGLWYNYAPSAG